MRQRLLVGLGLCLACVLFAGLPVVADSVESAAEAPVVEPETEVSPLELADPVQENRLDMFADGCPPELEAMCDPSCQCAHTMTHVICYGTGSACGVSYPNPYCD